jgi:hypothetical protein
MPFATELASANFGYRVSAALSFMVFLGGLFAVERWQVFEFAYFRASGPAGSF